MKLSIPPVVYSGRIDERYYHRVHAWVKREYGRPQECENCFTTDEVRYEWANLSEEYLQDISDWARLCVACHHLIDGTGSKRRWCRLGHYKGKGRCKKCVVLRQEYLKERAIRFAQGDTGRKPVTHCVNGHEYNEENTKYMKRNSGKTKPYRVCKICVRATGARKRARMKAEKEALQLKDNVVNGESL